MKREPSAAEQERAMVLDALEPPSWQLEIRGNSVDRSIARARVFETDMPPAIQHQLGEIEVALLFARATVAAERCPLGTTAWQPTYRAMQAARAELLEWDRLRHPPRAAE